MKKIVPIVITDKLVEVRGFYLKYFDSKVTFESPEYLGLAIGKNSLEIAFMKPCSDDAKFDGKGMVYSFETDNVDSEHERLKSAGLEVSRALQDNPWGDRSFSVKDPIGIDLYIYKMIEPAEEFKQYIKE